MVTRKKGREGGGEGRKKKQKEEKKGGNRAIQDVTYIDQGPAYDGPWS